MVGCFGVEWSIDGKELGGAEAGAGMDEPGVGDGDRTRDGFGTILGTSAHTSCNGG